MHTKPLSALLSSFESLGGTVVLINVDKERCDALIYHPTGELAIVPLLNLSLDNAEKLRSKWQSYLKQQKVRERRSMAPRSRSQLGDHLEAAQVLKCLWLWIGQPVLQALGLNKPVRS